MKLDTLAGNAALKRQLSAQAAGRGLSHAYLISGPAGSGKRTLARLMAAALVCGGAGERPCGVCPHCRKALGGIHPDIITIGDDGKDIAVAQARFLRSDAYIRPNEAERKVYVVQNAQTMNASAQNAILKLLEEGPAYAAFLLLTDNPGALLPTIRSRCEGLSLSPVTVEEAQAVLARRFPDRDCSAIRAAAESCGGLIGKAVEALAGEEANAAARQDALALLDFFARGDELGMAQFCVGLEKKDREGLTALFDQGIVLLRDALAGQTGAEALKADAAALARRDRKALLAAVRTLEELRSAAGFNVGAGHLCGALCAGLSQAGR